MSALRSIVLAVVFLAGANVSIAQTWQQIGPWGAPATDLALNPELPGRYLLGVQFSGLWLSEDYGESWTQVGPTAMHDLDIGGVAISPWDSDFVVANFNSRASMLCLDSRY